MGGTSSSGRLAVAVGAIIVVLLQIIVAPNITIAGAMPNFILAYVVVVAVASPTTCGLVMPFVLGLIFDLVGSGPVGALALLLVVAAFALTRLVAYFGNGTLFVSIATTVVSVFVIEIVYAVLMMAFGDNVGFLGALGHRALPDGLYTCVCALITYPIVVRFVARRPSDTPDMPTIG